MQTIQIEVKEDYIQNVLTLLQSLKGVMIEDAHLENDPNLVYDPYFYERKKSLEQTLDAVKNGEMELYDFNDSIDTMIKTLQNDANS